MATSAEHAEPWFVAAGRMLYDGWNFAQFVSGITLAAWASQVTGIQWSIPLGPWLFVRRRWCWASPWCALADKSHAVFEYSLTDDRRR